MVLKTYQKICYKCLRMLVKRSSQQEHLKSVLEKAHMEIRPDAYVAFAWMNAFIAGLSGIALIIIYFRILPTFGIVGPSNLLIIIIPSPFLLATLAYAITLMIPDTKVTSRRKDIDTRLPYALNFIAAMASAGVTPVDIFRSLAEQPIYGEIQQEAKWIYRDVSIFGMDIVTTLKRASTRSPSTKFQEILQGAITTVTSGGKLKPYFLQKAEQYMRENRRVQKEFLETLGILAESYVTVAVAGPLFLIVLLSVMSLIGGGADSSRMLLYLIAFIILPLTNFAFTYVIQTGSPKS